MRSLALPLTLVFVGLSAVIACTAPTADSDSSEAASTGADDLEILFSPAYSAFDGAHEFKVPAKVDGVKNVKWSASDPEMVDLDPQADGSVLITTRKAGTVTIIAKNGSLSGKSELTITQATPEEWQAGQERYNNGVVLERRRGDGGKNREQAKQAACTNCHGPGANDVEHTPMQTGGFTDQELVDIFTKGKKPDGVEQRIMPAERWSRIHQWSMTELATKGLVVYLRSLEPKSQGPVDWMGRGGKGKGGKGGRRDGGGGGNGDGRGGAP